MATRSHEVLPVRIQMTLEERRAYHRRFFYIFTFCLIFLLAVSIMTGIEVNKEPDLWLIILLLWCPLLVLNAGLSIINWGTVGSHWECYCPFSMVLFSC